MILQLVDLFIGLIIFVLGQVCSYVLSGSICEISKHYIDGWFFATVSSLISVMIVYKYWDSITKDDLEFSVGGKLNEWEIRDPLLSSEAMSFKNTGIPKS